MKILIIALFATSVAVLGGCAGDTSHNQEGSAITNDDDQSKDMNRGTSLYPGEAYSCANGMRMWIDIQKSNSEMVLENEHDDVTQFTFTNVIASDLVGAVNYRMYSNSEGDMLKMLDDGSVEFEQASGLVVTDCERG